MFTTAALGHVTLCITPLKLSILVLVCYTKTITTLTTGCQTVCALAWKHAALVIFVFKNKDDICPFKK